MTTTDSAAPAPRGCLSEALLTWLVSVVRRGWSQPLQPDDIPTLGGGFRSRAQKAVARRAWEAELAKAPRPGGAPSLYPVIWAVQGGQLLLGLLCAVAQGLCNCVARPLLLRAVVQAAMDNELGSFTAHTALLVAVFALTVFAEGFLQTQTKQQLSTRGGTRFIAWTTAFVHDKAARLAASATASDSAASSLIGNDVLRTFEDWKWACLLPMCLSALLGGCAVLLWLLGRAALVGFCVMATTVSLNYCLSGRTKRAEHASLRDADARLAVLLEIVTGI